MARTGKARPVGASSLHESTANRIITRIEDALISSGKFSLPKRREVEETQWTVVLIDVTESPIEKPKKRSDVTSAEKSNATL